MYTRGTPTGLTAAFLDYMRAGEIQDQLVPQLGYISVAQVRARKTP
jgi:phosphate transport system substrate-binding protein